MIKIRLPGEPLPIDQKYISPVNVRGRIAHSLKQYIKLNNTPVEYPWGELRQYSEYDII